MFEFIWNAGLMLFGFPIILMGILMGILMNLHQRIPKFLCYLTLISGLSYIVVHLLKLTYIDSQFVTDLELI
ncbi:MAG: hypothetical protein P8I82_05815 [Flavobacteriales bacterium]|nr:hypothetical protein [Flavobacteriales bacterium]